LNVPSAGTYNYLNLPEVPEIMSEQSNLALVASNAMHIALC